jgi:hypothetical protein
MENYCYKTIHTTDMTLHWLRNYISMYVIKYSPYRKNFEQKLQILIIISPSTYIKWSWGNSVSIVSDYGLGDWGSVPGRDKGFSFQLLRPDWLWNPPSLLSNGFRGVPSPGVKRSRGVTLTTHPHLVPGSRMSRCYTSSVPSASMAYSGKTLLHLYCKICNPTNSLAADLHMLRFIGLPILVLWVGFDKISVELCVNYVLYWTRIKFSRDLV